MGRQRIVVLFTRLPSKNLFSVNLVNKVTLPCHSAIRRRHSAMSYWIKAGQRFQLDIFYDCFFFELCAHPWCTRSDTMCFSLDYKKVDYTASPNVKIIVFSYKRAVSKSQGEHFRYVFIFSFLMYNEKSCRMMFILVDRIHST